MIEKDYEFYKAHREELLRDHAGEFVAIESETIRGFFPDQLTGIAAMKGYKPGNFLVKKVIPESEDYISLYTPDFLYAS